MPNLARRRALALLAAAAGTPAAADAPVVADAVALRKLAFSTGPAPFFWWLRGTRYGLVEGEMTPFWDMHVGTLARAQSLPGGGWQVFEIATSFYTDIATGAFIDHFKNPFTGKTVPILYYPAKMFRTVFQPNGQPLPTQGNTLGLTSRWNIGPSFVENGQLTMRFDHQLRGALNGQPVRVNDLTTYTGALADIQNPAIQSVPATQIFNDDNTWPPWLAMGTRPGTYFSRTSGAKVFDYDEMPALWRSLMAVRHPEVAKNPLAALGDTKLF